MGVFSRAKTELGEILSAFEFWDSDSQTLLDQHFPNNTLPLSRSKFFVLIETGGSDGEHDFAKIIKFLEGLEGAGLVTDGTIAQDETQSQKFWALREGIPEACAKEGVVYKYDVSLPSTQMYGAVESLRGRLEAHSGVKNVIGYGHFGDGNIHINIATETYDEKVVDTTERFIYDFISNFGCDSF